MLKNMKLGPKLIAVFLLVGSIPLAVLGTVSLIESSNALSNQAFGQLSSVRAIKKSQVETYFEDRKHDMDVLLETVETLYQEAFSKLESVQELKRAQIADLFGRITGDVKALARSGDLLAIYAELARYHDEKGIGPAAPFDVGTGRYKEIYNRYGRYLNDYVKEYGYYDMFLESMSSAIRSKRPISKRPFPAKADGRFSRTAAGTW